MGGERGGVILVGEVREVAVEEGESEGQKEGGGEKEGEGAEKERGEGGKDGSSPLHQTPILYRHIAKLTLYIIIHTHF